MMKTDVSEGIRVVPIKFDNKRIFFIQIFHLINKFIEFFSEALLYKSKACRYSM